MGHSTHEQVVSIDQARTTDQAIREAVTTWHDTESDRYDDERSGRSKTFPLMAGVVALHAAGSPGFEVFDGVSVAIPICDEADVVQKTVKQKFEVSADALAQTRAYGLGNFWDIVRKSVGPTVTGIEIVQLPKLRKPVATATEGKSTTKYFLCGSDGRPVSDYFDSQSAARAAGIAMMNDKPKLSGLEVRASIVRGDSNRALVSITRPQSETSEITLNITTSVPKTNAKQTGWYVAFDYHH